MNAGDMIAITCVALGAPLPYITWSKNGSDLSNDSRHTISEVLVSQGGMTFVKSDLEICATEGETDSLEYECSADNEAGSDSASFQLSVTTTGIYIRMQTLHNDYNPCSHTPS